MSDDPEVLCRGLARRAVELQHTGRVLEGDELMTIYQQRHRLKPSQPDLRLILASMLQPESCYGGTSQPAEVPMRKQELGWFWFRHFSRRQLTRLLLDLARCRHLSVRRSAMRLLAHVRTKEAFAALLDFVKDRDAEFADAAVRALGRFPPVKTLPHLRRMANDNSLATKLRATALWALGRFKRAEDRLLLRGLAADPSWNIRRVVVGALSAYRHPEDAAIVRKLTRDRDETVRSSTIRFIGRGGQPEDRHWLRQLVLDLTHEDRAGAVEALATFKHPDDLPLIRKLTRDEDCGVRWSAAAALGKFQHPADVKLLKRMARRQTAGPLDGLLAYPAKMVAAAFRELATDKEDCLRINLAIRLAEWRHPDAPRILRRLVGADDCQLRAAAVASLAAHGQAQDLPLLRGKSRFDTEMVRKEAVWGVARFGKPEDLAFVKESMKDESPGVVALTAMALTRLMRRADLERWLEKHGQYFRIVAWVEFDFGLYAPRWLAKTYPRIGDANIGIEPQILAIEWGPEGTN